MEADGQLAVWDKILQEKNLERQKSHDQEDVLFSILKICVYDTCESGVHVCGVCGACVLCVHVSVHDGYMFWIKLNALFLLPPRLQAEWKRVKLQTSGLSYTFM